MLNGFGGDDVLISGPGNGRDWLGGADDWMDGGDGIDRASYAGMSDGVTVRLDRTTAQNTGGAGRDKLLNVENLTGSGFDDKLTGSGLANMLDGGNGMTSSTAWQATTPWSAGRATISSTSIPQAMS